MSLSETASEDPETVLTRRRPHDCWLKTGLLLLSLAPAFVPIDSRGGSVLVCDYTGKEVVG
jgi:hypothetical protein